MARNRNQVVLDKFGEPPEFERSHSYGGILRPTAHDLVDREALRAFRDRKLRAAQEICERTLFEVDPTDSEIVIHA